MAEKLLSKKLCWQCNKRLLATYFTIWFNGSPLNVHKSCYEDAKNLLFTNKVTFQGEEPR